MKTALTSEIKIHLGDRRNRTQNAAHQCLHGIQEPFGSLRVFDEVMLKPGGTLFHKVKADGLFFLMPLVGISEVTHTEKQVVDAGNIYFNHVEAHSEIKITNPYEKEWTSFVLWELQSNWSQGAAVAEFDLHTEKNKLVRLFKGSLDSSRISIRAGMFEGRSDGRLSLPNTNQFIFVLEGAFEVQNRLLHTHDALSIPACSHLEFEALSSNAILLIVSQF